MSVLVIQGDESNQKLLLALAKKMGSKAITLKNEEMEDLLFGQMMAEAKTGKLVSKDEVLKVLRKA